MTDKQNLVKEIIDENRYLNLATTDGELPWVAPVEYVVDDELNFYFQSLETSRHIQHIQQNPTVGISIYDSQQPSRTGRGVEIRAMVGEYKGKQNPAVLYSERYDSPEDVPDIDPRYSIFKIVPHQFYVPESYLKEDGIDRRIEVEME